MEKNVCVLGSGAWGTALSNLLADNGHRVRIYGVCLDEIDEINKTHTNTRYFKDDYVINSSIKATNDLDWAIQDAEIIVLAVPSFAIKENVKNIEKYLTSEKIIVNVAKGFDKETQSPLGQFIRDCLPFDYRKNVASLLGPTFAEEVSEKQFTAITVSATDLAVMKKVQEVFSNEYFRVYTNHDTIGAEYCAALKNVIALACGIIDGIGCKVNTRAALITRGMVEIMRYVTLFGGDEKTCYGLAGVGDLILTCSSTTSRNYTAGHTIGARGIEYFLKNNTKTVEGVMACEIAYEISKKHSIYSPIIEAVYNVIHAKSLPKEEMKKMMHFILKAE